jgi:hypothetical protein
MSSDFQITTNGKYVFEIFPDEILALDKELNTGYHPRLDFIRQYPTDEIDIKLAQIAAYCEVVLDGDYSLKDRMKLCKILTEKLILKREDPNASKIIISIN